MQGAQETMSETGNITQYDVATKIGLQRVTTLKIQIPSIIHPDRPPSSLISPFFEEPYGKTWKLGNNPDISETERSRIESSDNIKVA